METFHKQKSNKMQQCIKILLFHIHMKLRGGEDEEELMQQRWMH
jgi:hypothetical protein